MTKYDADIYIITMSIPWVWRGCIGQCRLRPSRLRQYLPPPLASATGFGWYCLNLSGLGRYSPIHPHQTHGILSMFYKWSWLEIRFSFVIFWLANYVEWESNCDQWLQCTVIRSDSARSKYFAIPSTHYNDEHVCILAWLHSVVGCLH